MTLRHPGLNRPSRARTRGFTLVELLIVVAILVILAVVLLIAVTDAFGKSKETTTEGALQAIGDSGLNSLKTKGELINLAKPDKVGKFVTKEFRAAAGIKSGTTFKDLNEMQRSKLLAFLVAPSKTQWDTIVTDRKLRYEPALQEETAKEFLSADGDGFNYVKDAWDRPITFELTQSIGAGTDLKWTLRSAGEDGQWGTNDDMNYSETEKHYKGKFTP